MYLSPNKSLEITDLSTVQNSQVSADYLTKPIEVSKEMCRVLKPGGLAIVRWSFCPLYMIRFTSSLTTIFDYVQLFLQVILYCS